MSFTFDWQAFARDDLFYEKCKGMLNVALNKNLPKIIEGPITVSELSWGDEPPSLETLEIGEVGNDKFRGIFKLEYKGSGRLTLATKVQANLLNVYTHTAPEFTLPTFVCANNGLSIPLELTLSDIRMSGIMICVFSRQKGLTCVFRNDPLQSIKVSSTFDGIPGIASFLQSQIENLIGGLFREELPAILYSHSQIWTRLEELRQKQEASIPREASPEDADTFSELREQLELDHSALPVTFAEIDGDKQVSFVNTLLIESLAVSRRTLALSTPVVPTTILRSELSRRHAIAASAVPVSVDGAQIHDHVHTQAQRLAMKSNARPKRRVLNLRKSKQEMPEASIVSSDGRELRPERPELPRTMSSPARALGDSIVDTLTSPRLGALPVAGVAKLEKLEKLDKREAKVEAQPEVKVEAHQDTPAHSLQPEHEPDTARHPARAKVPYLSQSLPSQTKAEIERIKSMLIQPKLSTFLVPATKHDSPPAYADSVDSVDSIYVQI